MSPYSSHTAADSSVDTAVDELLERSLSDDLVDQLADDVCSRVMHVVRSESADVGTSMVLAPTPAAPVRRSYAASLAMAAGLSAGVTLLVAWSAGVTAKSNIASEEPVEAIPQIAVMGPGDLRDQAAGQPEGVLVVGLPVAVVRHAPSSSPVGRDAEGVIAFSGIETNNSPASEAKAAAGVQSEASPFSTYASTLVTEVKEAPRRHVVAATDVSETLPVDLGATAPAAN